MNNPSWPEALQRSRLYKLVPCQAGTIWRESLTSYINRLGWAHHISPRALVAQEIAPRLIHRQHVDSARQLSTFSSLGAMVLNSGEEEAQEWATLLEQLTTRVDVHRLTWPWLVGDLPSQRQLRRRPAWCPACFQEWQDAGSPLYQPLLWTLQVVNLCPQHHRLLENRCPACQKYQAVIVRNATQPGVCVHCSRWLGTLSEPAHKPDEAFCAWQAWIFLALKEVCTSDQATEYMHWSPFFVNLAESLETRGAMSRFTRATGVTRGHLYQLVDGPSLPQLHAILRFCHGCEMTPLEFMRARPEDLAQVIRQDTPRPAPRIRPVYRPLDRVHCFEVLQAVLTGNEEPLSLRQIARRLGCTHGTLVRHFPQECALVAQRAQIYRKQRGEQRVERICEKVRQAVGELHRQGIFPTGGKLDKMFSSSILLSPEARSAFHAARRELGLEP